MKKRKILICCVLIMALVFAGCGKKTQTADGADNEATVAQDSAAEDSADASDDDSAVGTSQIANPIVEVDSDQEFQKQLGITWDTSCFMTKDFTMSIIGDNVAQIIINKKDVNGDDAEITLRGTKDDSLAENPVESLAGIYSSDLEDLGTVNISTDNGDLVFHNVEDKTDGYQITYFDYDDVHYTISYSGALSQMQIAEVNDQILDVIGANETGQEEDVNTNEVSQTSLKKTVTIAIDPGHGGENEEKSHGVEYVYNGVTVMEKNINYTIASKLAAYLQQAGVNVIMTRTGDYDVSLTERVNIAKKNNADYFVSIHVNSSSRGLATDNGCMILCTQSHYNNVYDDSVALAKSILPYLQQLGLDYSSDWDVNTTGGLLQRARSDGKTYKDGSVRDYYGIIAGCTEAGIPSVIVEHAFLSCPTDYYNYLSDDTKLDALAQADANGIIAFLKSKGQL